MTVAATAPTAPTAPIARTGSAAPSWRGGFGRLWGAAVIPRFGDGMRSAALPLLAAAVLFGCAACVLIPALPSAD